MKPNIYGALAASSLGIPVVANVSGLGTAFIRAGLLQRLVTGLYRIAFRSAATVFFKTPTTSACFSSGGSSAPARRGSFRGRGWTWIGSRPRRFLRDRRYS